MSYVSPEADHDFNWFKVCEEKVIATVIGRDFSGSEGIWATMFGAAMDAGFVLDWYSGIECGKCELSGGHCGYNNTEDEEFLCFCKDGSIKPDHCKGKKLSQRLRLAVGVKLFSIMLISMK